jgi:hypothetical protein
MVKYKVRQIANRKNRALKLDSEVYNLLLKFRGVLIGDITPKIIKTGKHKATSQKHDLHGSDHVFRSKMNSPRTFSKSVNRDIDGLTAPGRRLVS